MIFNSLIKRTSLALALWVSFSAVDSARAAGPEETLKPGAKVPSLELEGVTWVKGEPVTTLDEEGKVYMLECWATWCGPCIFAIPHVNELHQKYADKGLVVIGMSSLEDDLDKVKTFVSNRGDEMSYRVAFSGGRKSEFSDQWLKPAGVKGIPHTFIVKDGELVVMAHPSEIDDQLIESLLAGEFDQQAFTARLAAAKQREQEINSKVYPMAQSGQWNELETYAREQLKAEPADQRRWLIISNANLGDWRDLAKILGQPAKQADMELMLVQSAFITPEGEGAQAFANEALKRFSTERIAEIKGASRRAAPILARARYLWLSGDKEGAKQLVDEFASEMATWPDSERTKHEYSPNVEKLKAKLAAGEFPPVRDLGR